MAKKRGNGEGTICRRKDGVWCAAITAGRDPETGKLKRFYFYGKTRQEVAEKLARALGDVRTGTFLEPSRVTVGQWLDTWLNEYKKPPKIRPTTWDSYEMHIRVHIKPAIGVLPLRQLQPHHLQRLYNEKFAAGRVDGRGGLSTRTVEIIHTIMHAALDQAVKEGLVARNVAEATTLPKKEKGEPRALTPEEQERVFAALDNDRLGAAFVLALGSGLRRGEILALRWQDVDLKEGALRVRRCLVRTRDPEDPTRWVLAFHEPKTAKGRRSIPIPRWAVAALKAHKVRQNQEKLRLGGAYQDADLVFATEDGRPICPRDFNRRFDRLKALAGLPEDVTLHSLRHTYATRLLEAGEHPKVVQELLGHAQIGLTLDTYSHVLPELKKSAAAKLESLWPKNLSSQKKNLQP